MVFLETLSMMPDVNMMNLAGGKSMGILIIGLLIIFVIYIYASLAYSKIGSKTKLNNPGIAWMPFWGPIATIFETAKAHWWPFLVGLIGYAIAYLLTANGLLSAITNGNSTSLTLGLIVLTATIIMAIAMITTWHWKTYEAVDKKGWFALIPILGVILGVILMYLSQTLGLIIFLLAIISHFVFVGIAAWGK
ncbi:MAG: hypothetical protein WC548_00455 [Candidatus Pacearchaeota archaeon]